MLLFLLACAPEPEPVVLAEGQYWIYVPPDLPSEGVPVVAHLHHSGDGRSFLEDPKILADLEEARMIGVFPDGGGEPGDDWRVGENKDDIPRDDRAFLADVARDLKETRDDIGQLWLSGYSKGGAMTYDMACLGESIYSGYLPMSGAFQDWVPEDCTGEARPVRHLQGDDDDKWPVHTIDDPESSHEGIIDSLAGLPISDDGCVDAEPITDGDCVVWDTCQMDVRLCFFDGGHIEPEGWLLEHRAWIDSVAGALE